MRSCLDFLRTRPQDVSNFVPVGSTSTTQTERTYTFPAPSSLQQSSTNPLNKNRVSPLKIGGVVAVVAALVAGCVLLGLNAPLALAVVGGVVGASLLITGIVYGADRCLSTPRSNKINQGIELMEMGNANSPVGKLQALKNEIEGFTQDITTVAEDVITERLTKLTTACETVNLEVAALKNLSTNSSSFDGVQSQLVTILCHLKQPLTQELRSFLNTWATTLNQKIQFAIDMNAWNIQHPNRS